MKITRRRLTRLMEEAATARPPYSVPEAEKALQGQAQGPGAGNTFGELASIELSKGDYKKAANRLMDALWIDDVWPEQEEELSDALSAAASKHGDTVMDVIPQLMSDWMTDYRANPGGKPDHPSHPSWDKGR